jgi:hypothetical protein
MTIGNGVCRDEHNAAPISLDVGGTVYTASRSVLKAVPDSWLARVANGGINLPKNANDVRFIERDSQVRSRTPRNLLEKVNSPSQQTVCWSHSLEPQMIVMCVPTRVPMPFKYSTHVSRLILDSICGPNAVLCQIGLLN